MNPFSFLSPTGKTKSNKNVREIEEDRNKQRDEEYKKMLGKGAAANTAQAIIDRKKKLREAMERM